MKKLLKNITIQIHTEQAGQALILVLILLMLGSLVLVPALALSGTALKTGEIYETKTNEIYTADAGIDAGIWRIKYEFLGPGYTPYDFDTAWEYETDSINDMTANVTIQNVWIPSNVTLGGLGLSATEAQAIVEGAGEDPPRLVVTGSSGAIPGQPYDIKIDYNPATSENLTVKSIGVWLPQGFTYATGSGTLESANPSTDYYCVPSVTAVDGGTAIVWSYGYPYPLFTEFPGVDPYASPMSAEISFSYTPPSGSPSAMPTAIAWITTELDNGSPSAYPISWDVDTRIYKITSNAGGTAIEAYSSKCELRQMGDAISGDYVAVGNSLMNGNPIYRDNLISSSSFTVSDIPEDADVLYAYLYWTGWNLNMTGVLADYGSEITTNWNRTSPTDWTEGSGEYLAHNVGGSTDARYLTLSPENLSAYVPGSILLTWDQGTKEYIFYDNCNDLDEWTNGSDWTESSNRLRGSSNGGGADGIITMTTGQDLSASGSGTATISWTQYESSNIPSDEGLDYAFSSDNGSSWSASLPAFRGNIGSSPVPFSATVNSTYWTNGFKLRFEMVGMNSETLYVDNVAITPDYTSSDGLDYAVSRDGGANWSENMEVFRGDLGGSTDDFSYYLPGSYTTNQFQIRFETVGMEGPGQRASLDNFVIRSLAPDNSIEFSINGQPVYLDGAGAPQAGASDLVAPDCSALINIWGYSWACRLDVSELVKKYPVSPGEDNHDGNAVYTVGSVYADTGNLLSHAGWSLIIIYGSPSTAGHYLYLRDFFAFNSGGGMNLDFDFDGSPGGDITDFVIPEPIRNKAGTIIETIAAKVTCFIGEGDAVYSGDSLRITGEQSGASMYLTYPGLPSYNNVWDGDSIGMSYAGIDVDTFEVLWSDGILQPGDTSLHLDMVSSMEAWNFIYLILSVRSETLTSGTTHYVIGHG